MPDKLNEFRVAIIGGGKMGEAIMAGWIHSHTAPADQLAADNFIVVDPGEERRGYLTETYGVQCEKEVSTIDHADMIVLAVKPQVLLAVLEEVAPLEQFQSCLFVSIAAGMATHTLENVRPKSSRLVRVMPNTPLLVGAGASTLCGGTTALPDDVEVVESLFACLGEAHIVEEVYMDATGALSGSGPAYVSAMIEALTQAGVEQGLDADLAEKLMIQTVYGTSKLMKDTGQSPESVRLSVCSPNGTTLAALEAMDAAGMEQVYEQGVEAAVRRSKELGSCQ